MDIPSESTAELSSKIEVLRDLEGRVRELMDAHERKRDLWYPADLLQAGPDSRGAGSEYVDRRRAAPLSPAARRLPGRRQLLATVEQPVDRRRGPARTGAARLRPRHPPVRSAQDRGDAV